MNEKRRADMAREESFDGFEAYLQHHRGEVEITQAEIDSLKNLNNPGKAVLTRAEALEDVDLFFRALHYSYGAYYYFGEETFQKAEDAIRAELASYQTITKDQLISLVYPHPPFIRDAHFRFGTEQNEPAFEDGVQYLYYYCNRSFGKDENGYYLLGQGEKWYYTSCGNANAEMQPYLERPRVLFPVPVLPHNSSTYNRHHYSDKGQRSENGFAHMDAERVLSGGQLASPRLSLSERKRHCP